MAECIGMGGDGFGGGCVAVASSGGDCGDFLVPSPIASLSDPSRRTLSPTVTGSSLVAIALKDCVLVCGDTLGSYGKLARFKGIKRFSPIGKNTVVAASGEYSDYQYISNLLEERALSDWVQKDQNIVQSKEYASLLSRILYVRRSKLNPLWNAVLVGGFQDDESYLAYIDMYGTFYEEKYAATGFGKYLGITLLREQYRPDMTETEGRKLLEGCMRVCFYRDCMASDEIQFARVTRGGVVIEKPYKMQTTWDLSDWTAPTSQMPLAGCSW